MVFLRLSCFGGGAALFCPIERAAAAGFVVFCVSDGPKE